MAFSIETYEACKKYVDEHGGGGGGGDATQAWVNDNFLKLTGGTETGTLYFGTTDYYITTDGIAQLSTITSNGYTVLTTNDLTGYATQSWVQNQGYLTSSSLSGYATQSWVTSQGYLTSSSLSGYATQTWVTNQGYITSSSLSGYATQNWVTSQLGNYALISNIDDYVGTWMQSEFDPTDYGLATQTWVTNQGYIKSTDFDPSTYMPKSGGTFTGNVYYGSTTYYINSSGDAKLRYTTVSKLTAGITPTNINGYFRLYADSGNSYLYLGSTNYLLSEQGNAVLDDVGVSNIYSTSKIYFGASVTTSSTYGTAPTFNTSSYYIDSSGNSFLGLIDATNYINSAVGFYLNSSAVISLNGGNAQVSAYYGSFTSLTTSSSGSHYLYGTKYLSNSTYYFINNAGQGYFNSIYIRNNTTAVTASISATGIGTFADLVTNNFKMVQYNITGTSSSTAQGTAGYSIGAGYATFYGPATSQSGYKAVGVVSAGIVNGTSSGSGESYCYFYSYGISASANNRVPISTPTATVYGYGSVRCSNSSGKVYVRLFILWVKGI